MNNDHDPLSALRGDDVPVAPDPEFAARLRARLESAASLFAAQPDRTEGVVMSGTDTAIAELSETSAAPAAAAASPRPAALPYLAVVDARAAIDWYVDALGATVVGEPIVMDDGRIGHAELALAGGVLYLADEYPELGLRAPAPQSVSVSLMLQVTDTDAALERARSRGAQVQQEVYEDHGARGAAIVDPFGHRWMLSGPLTGGATPIRHGDVGFVSLWTPDADRAAAFYSHVLGWAYDPATHRVTNTGQRIGIFSVGNRNTLFCCYAVTDLAGARQSILDGGGSVDEVQQFDFGAVLGATDASGMEFAVYQPAPDDPRPELNGGGPGELSYITYEVEDSAAFKSFYSRVLFWTFERGRVADGWGVMGAHPMSGMAGGNSTATTVPMWTVADVDAAVQRVTEAGGTVLDQPARQPYGVTAQCTDDQGGRFYLGEF
ncbi:VOC family protein [Mycobacterium sp. NPDC050041]|uniref:VOC family protein n=1 Tax=Mycobacterium sp. NPDC050041 TaxID=3364293 RepID=UPI003C2B0875